MDIVRKLRNRALPDPSDEREVTHAPLLNEAADEIERLREECREAWKEAAIGWTVCGSVHEQWAKGKDALYTTRHGDFERHAEEARQRHHLLTHNARVKAAAEGSPATEGSEP